MAIPTFREVQDTVHRILRQEGGLGVLLVDLAPLARVERSFGASAYQGVRLQLDAAMREMLTSVVRAEDTLTRHESEGDRFLLFLAPRRDAETRFRMEDLHKLADRVQAFMTPRVARLTQPYLRERYVVDAGYGFVLWSPLESEERQVLRLVDDAFSSAEMRRQLRERDERERLYEVIHNRDVWTAFQDIVEIDTRETMAYEALSRGPRGSDLQSPLALFGQAARYGVTEELERACRRKAFADWEMFGAPTRLFVNTVPATVRDPSFLGKGVLDYLGPRLSPRSVTLEITERQVIDNLGLYREAMASFTELGFSFAIDDLGAGYSGLETLATLGATYLKIDMGLVRGVHQKPISQQVVKAILEMGNGVGAAVIAEGIEVQEEADALMDLGIRFGQGYLWGRPHDPYAPRPRLVARDR
jgi:EAL domain-containing protein (putative c-di-GMP-specific phosphodiesterase class I)